MSLINVNSSSTCIKISNMKSVRDSVLLGVPDAIRNMRQNVRKNNIL